MNMKRKIKKTIELTEQLIEELEDHSDIYFKERPFLENGGKIKFIDVDQRMKRQNTQNIINLCQELEN